MSIAVPSVEKNSSPRRRRAPAAPAEGLPLMTRQQLVPFLNAHGIPISESTLSKLCSPAINRGPPIHSWWGKRPLHEPEASLEWARSMLRDRPTDIATKAEDIT
jgi:hypothetical protein